MRRLQSTTLLTLLAMTTAIVTAEDKSDSVTQSRFALGTVPGIATADREFATNTTNGSQSFPLHSDGGWALNYGSETFHGASLIDFGFYKGLFVREQRGSDKPNTRVVLDSAGLTLGLDLVVKPSENLALTIGPRGSAGVAYQAVIQNEYKDSFGYTYSWGVQAGAYFTVSRLVLGIEGGVMSWTAKTSHHLDQAFTSADGALERAISHGKGGYGALVLGFSF